MSDDHTRTIIVGLSGPSSSGKTTLARLLREIFNTTTSTGLAIKLFIVHEDDFYKTDVDIPWRKWTSPEYGERRLQDWDCVESLDLPLIRRITDYIKSRGHLPTDFASKEDQNSVGETGISEDELAVHREAVHQWLQNTIISPENISRGTIREIRICILEGFLLFPAPRKFLTESTDESSSSSTTSPEQLLELNDILDPNLNLKVLLPSTKQLTISRRKARSGYVTLEGFWEDPQGYVEELVWPNYVRDHAWLFDSTEDADQGTINIQTAEQENILVGPGRGNQGMRMVLDWGVDTIKAQIKSILQ